MSALAAALCAALAAVALGRAAVQLDLAGRVRRCGPGPARGVAGVIDGPLRRVGGGRSPAVTAAMLVGGLAAAAVLTSWAGRPLLGLPVAAAVPLALVAHGHGAARRRAARVAAHLPEVASGLATALRAGLSLRQALVRAADAAPEPAAGELRRVARELALGGRLEDALAGFAARCSGRDAQVMVTAILIQRRSGGNLAAALADLSTRLDARARLARELRGLTAQARLTAGMVGGLPALAGLAVELAAPGTLARSLGHGAGPMVVVVATLLYGAGALLIRRIGRVEL